MLFRYAYVLLPGFHAAYYAYFAITPYAAAIARYYIAVYAADYFFHDLPPRLMLPCCHYATIRHTRDTR